MSKKSEDNDRNKTTTTGQTKDSVGENDISLVYQLLSSMPKIRDKIDENLLIFRVSCVAVIVGSALAAVRYSGVLNRFKNIHHIPQNYFDKRKSICGIITNVSEIDPSVWHFVHRPLVYRIFSVGENKYKKDDTIPIRSFGVSYADEARPWIDNEVLMRNPNVTLTLLHREENEDTGDEVAVGEILSRKMGLKHNYAKILLSKGLGQIRNKDIMLLRKDCLKLKRDAIQIFAGLEKAQGSAQLYHLGIWKNYKESNMKDTILSYAARSTSSTMKSFYDWIKSFFI